MEREKIVIGITQGDINGIGYEVILKTLAESRVLDAFVPVIYGSPKVAAFHRKQLDIQGINLNIINTIDELNPKRINIINCTDDEIKVELGRSTEEAGKAAFASLERATEDLKNRSVGRHCYSAYQQKEYSVEGLSFPRSYRVPRRKVRYGNFGFDVAYQRCDAGGGCYGAYPC